MNIFLDSDILAYEAATHVNKEISWDDGTDPLLVGDLKQALASYDSLVNSCVTAVQLYYKVDKVNVTHCLSTPDKQYFRKELCPSYKENRKGMKPPAVLGELKKALVDYPQSKWMLSLEADDVMGIEANLCDYDCLIVSADKDLDQIPCRRFNPRTGNFYSVTPERGAYFHMIQTLSGDRVDNYKGCPKIGPIRAVKILADKKPQDWWPTVVDTYAKKGLTEEDALLQARLAWIVQDPGNYLWEPKYLEKLYA